MSDQEEVEFEYTATVFTKISDWIVFHPEATDAAVRLYAGLRSTVHEKKSRGQLRSLTLSHMQRLLPPVKATKGKHKGKWVPVDVKKVREALHCLIRIGGMTETRKASHHAPARYRLNTAPPAGYEGWLSGWERLNHIISTDEDPDTRGTEVGTPASGVPNLEPQESNFGTPESNFGTPESNFGTPDLENSQVNGGADTPKKDPSNKDHTKNLSQESTGPSESDPDGVIDAEVVEDENERETPSLPQQAHSGTDLVVAAWIDAFTTAAGQPPAPEAVDHVRRDVAALLNAGRAAAELLPAAVDMAQRRPTYRKVSKHLAYYTPPQAEASAAASESKIQRRRRQADEVAARFAAKEAAQNADTTPALTGGSSR